MPQGKAVDLRGRQFVVRLKEVFDQERRAGVVVSTKDPAGRVAKALGLGKRTVKDILSTYHHTGQLLSSWTKIFTYIRISIRIGAYIIQPLLAETPYE